MLFDDPLMDGAARDRSAVCFTSLGSRPASQLSSDYYALSLRWSFLCDSDGERFVKIYQLQF